VSTNAAPTGGLGMTFALSESPILSELLTSSDPVVRRVSLKALKSTGWMVQQNWRQYFKDPGWASVSKLTKSLDTRAGLKFLRQFVRYKAFPDNMAVAIGFGKGKSVKKKSGASYTGLGRYGLAAGSLLGADAEIMAIAEKAEYGWHGPVTERMRHYVAAATRARSKAKHPVVGRNYVAFSKSKTNIDVPARSVSRVYFDRIKTKISDYYLIKFSMNWKKIGAAA